MQEQKERFLFTFRVNYDTQNQYRMINLSLKSGSSLAEKAKT